jgi:ferredoxin
VLEISGNVKERKMSLSAATNKAKKLKISNGVKLKKILKTDIKELLQRSLKEWKTYVPLESKEGDILFTLLPEDKSRLEEALDRLNLKDEWVAVSPKDIFFPQLETLFSFDRNGIEEEVEASPKLIFGVRPCDAKGLLFSEEFFKRNFEDIYYLSRAKNRLIVTIGCLKPPRPDACFCTSSKTGPFIESGYDLQMIDAGDSYLVEIGSGKGEDFVNSYSDLFKDAEKDGAGKIENIKSEANKAVKVKVDFDGAVELMKGDKDFEDNYKRIGERCIYCGGCLYVCPTCTCFNVFDNESRPFPPRRDTPAGRKGRDEKEGSGVRRRNWDGCIFEGYTREASGHNPRHKKTLRTARRFEHKLKYDYRVTGMSGCVGCGRCLASCPVEIGFSKFIEEITANKRIM